MRIVAKGGLVALLMVPAVPVLTAVEAAATDEVTIVSPSAAARGGVTCAGDAVTVSWPEPGDSAGITGYRVVQRVLTASVPWTSTHDVAAAPRTITVNVLFGTTAFLVYAVTAQGVAPEPFAVGFVSAARPPSSMVWRPEGSSVGDRTAAVTFGWPGPVTSFTTGGSAEARVRVTASPDGAVVDLPAGDTATFGGLTNGVPYTFSAVAYNACGSSAPSGSPAYTPGVAPTWTRVTPPSVTSAGKYVYKLTASGEPSPEYRLIDAPSWLSIGPNGLVSGRPPVGTESFSFSVAASNGVGIAFYQRTDIHAGPFEVVVKTP